MDNNIFIELCKDKFSYLIEEFGFSDGTIEDDGIRLYITYEKPGFKLKIVNHIVECPSFPVVIYFTTEEKRLFNRFSKKVREYDLDDLLIYKKCNSQVYEYLDYTKIETFYEVIPEEQDEYYKEKYSSDEEVRNIIDKYSRLLKDFGSDILSGDFSILPEVGKLRKEYDAKYGCGSLLI